MQSTSTRDTIYATFKQVAAAQSRKLAPLTDELKLTECGLDSLSFAIVVTTLEESLKTDPFNSPEWVDFPVTLGDLVKLYDRSVG